MKIKPRLTSPAFMVGLACFLIPDLVFAGKQTYPCISECYQPANKGVCTCTIYNRTSRFGGVKCKTLQISQKKPSTYCDYSNLSAQGMSQCEKYEQCVLDEDDR